MSSQQTIMRRHADLMRKALNLAKERHAGQYREGGDPFITHPISVCNFVCKIADTYGLGKLIEEAQIVGLLHDIIEDTPTTYEELRQDFPEIIIVAVEAMTRIDEESYGDYIERVMQNPIACIVKIADIEHNISSLHTTNLSEHRKDRRRDKYKYYCLMIRDHLGAL